MHNLAQKPQGFSLFVFQVEATVTRHPLHRPGIEDFPHPVPRFRFFCQTVNHSGDIPRKRGFALPLPGLNEVFSIPPTAGVANL